MKATSIITALLARMAMTLLMLLSMTQGTWATEFITDVMVIGGDQAMTNYKKSYYKSYGWKVIDQNLNEGTNGDLIYLLYKTASESDPDATFVTGFALGNTAMDQMMFSDGRAYSLVPYDGGSDFRFSQGNLNNKAGGIPIYLYYIKATANDETHVVKSITFNNKSEGAIQETDLNFGCEGNDVAEIYMHADITKGWTYWQGNETECTMNYEGPKAWFTSITVPYKHDGLYVVAVTGLHGCINLETLNFYYESHLEQMPSMQGCTKLKNIYLRSNNNAILETNQTPPSMTRIPDNAFYGTAIEKLTMPSVTSVGDYAFEGCPLSSATFEQSNVQIGKRAFANISGTCVVSYNGSINNWNTNMYVFSPNLVVNASDGSCGWCGGDGATTENYLYWTLVNETGHLKIDWLWEGTPEQQVIETHNWTRDKVKSLTLNHVCVIGNGSFEGCSNLTSVTIGNDVTSIGNRAFSGCHSLTSVTIGNNVTSIGNSAFSGCYSLTSVTIGGSVTSIGDCAFMGCSTLTSVTIPNSVTSIGKEAFINCSSLTSVDIGDGVTYIGNYAFKGCSALTSVTIPNSVTCIWEGTFCECSGLTSIDIPNSVTYIGNNAFIACSALTSIAIPNSVTWIGESAFACCSSLTSVTISNSVTSIENWTFSQCISLASVTIPNSVTGIGEYAFYECFSLASLTIPNSMMYIEDYAFNGCTGMTDVYCYADPSVLEWDDGYYSDDINEGPYGGGYNENFKPNRETRCHVYNASEWDEIGDKVNVTIVGDLPVNLADNANNSTVLNTWNGKNVYTMLKGRSLYLDDKWNTLCLPFDVDDFNGTPLEGFTVKELDTEVGNGGHKTGFENGTLYLNFKDATSIEAGKPYIVRKKMDVEADLIISSDDDWNTFARNVSNGTSYEGQVVRLDADISVSTMAGTSVSPFKGTFDGNGHTISLDLNGGGEALALFYIIDGATIQNVKVTGTVTSSNHRPATFTAFANGNSTIKNCWSSVDIVSTRTSGWVDGGALVARVSADATLNMTDCLFTGSVTYHGGTSGGGMVGFTQSGATANLTNCLFCPSALTLTVRAYNPRIFVSGDESGNLANCYYNAVAKASVLTKEGIDGSIISADVLATAIGNNWEVCGNNVLPNCTSDIHNPIFASVTINSAAPTAVTSSDGAVSFMGSYSPVSIGNEGDNTILYMGAANKLYYPNAAMSINAFSGWFQLANALIDSSKGDVNGDKSKSVTDVTSLVNHILGTDDDTFIPANADVNGDNSISVTDVTELVNIILGNNSPFNVVTNLDDTPITFGSSGSGPARVKEKNLEVSGERNLEVRGER